MELSHQTSFCVFEVPFKALFVDAF